MSKPDNIDNDTMVGMLKKAARIVERAAKHPTFGSQGLWDISAAIKVEAARIDAVKGVDSYSDDQSAQTPIECTCLQDRYPNHHPNCPNHDAATCPSCAFASGR